MKISGIVNTLAYFIVLVCAVRFLFQTIKLIRSDEDENNLQHLYTHLLMAMLIIFISLFYIALETHRVFHGLGEIEGVEQVDIMRSTFELLNSLFIIHTISHYTQEQNPSSKIYSLRRKKDGQK